MGKCMVCGQETPDPIHVLEVRTLHVRDIDRAKRVQALGAFHDFYICDACAEKREQVTRLPLKAASPLLFRFGLVGAAGVILLVADLLVLHGDRVFLFPALAAIACCILAWIQTIRDAKERSRELDGMSPSQARAEAAFSLLKENAPKKDGDSSLTYIPVNGRTLQMKNGDLMIMYKLLPEIAVEAWKRIHQEHAGR